MDVKRIWYFIIFFVFSTITHADKLNLFILGGANVVNLKNTTMVQITDVVTNAYRTQPSTNWQGLWGVGLGHTFQRTNVYQLSLNATGYFANLGNVQGLEYPFINDGVYDSLNYNFHAKSTALMFESRLAYTQFEWQPYALIGIGESWNRLSGYNETQIFSALSAAPVSPTFSSRTHNAFAYELGAGIQHQLFNDLVHKIQYKGGLGYQYFNLGKGELGHFPAQTATDRLHINRLTTQAIVLSLNVSLY